MRITPVIRKKETNKVTFLGISVNILLTIFKFIAGISGSSSAMIADAFHSLSDLITDAVLIIGVHFGVKPADKQHPYGHGRFETFATMIIAAVLIIAAAGIFINGFKDVYKAVTGTPLEKPGSIALIIAGASIIIKEGMYQYTAFVGRKIKSTAVISNAWHHRSDALSSVAAFAGIGGAIILGEKWTILDPAAAMLVSIFILIIGIKIAKGSCDELMDSALPQEDINVIKELCLEIKGVKNPHNIKTRKIGFRMSVDLHVNIDKDTPFVKVHVITSKIERKIRKRFGNETFIYVHPEPL